MFQYRGFFEVNVSIALNPKKIFPLLSTILDIIAKHQLTQAPL